MYCKINSKIVFNPGETLFEKNMKNEYVQILNAFKELFASVATRIISSEECSLNDEIKLNDDENTKLKSIYREMSQLNIVNEQQKEVKYTK